MTGRRVIQQLKRVRNPYNAEEMDYAIKCVMNNDQLDALIEANSELFDDLREQARVIAELKEQIKELEER